MTSIEFINFMTQRGGTGAGNMNCAAFNGYPFTAVFGKGAAGGKTVVYINMDLTPAPKGKFMRELIATDGAHLQNITNNNSSGFASLRITVKANNDVEFAAAFDRFLVTVTGMAQRDGLYPSPACPICKQNGCDSYGLQGAIYRPVHAQCVQTTAAQKHLKAEKNLNEGNRGLGIIGAVLGAAVGAIPAILYYAFFDTIYIYLFALLCALEPLCSYYGYKLFRGKLDRGVLPVIIATSLLAIPYMVYGTVAVVFYSEGYTPPNFFEIFDSALAGIFGQIAIFVALGFFIVAGIVTRTAKGDIKDALSAAQSLRPIQPFPGSGVPVMAAMPAGVAPAAVQATPVQPQAVAAVPPVSAAPASAEVPAATSPAEKTPE